MGRRYKGGIGEEGVPRCSMQTEAARTACYDGDFAIEGEDGGEVFEAGLGFCFGGHFEVSKMWSMGWRAGLLEAEVEVKVGMAVI